MIGTNNDGPFNTNPVHPYENPNALTNFMQILCVLIIPAALCFMFSGIAGDGRQGWAVPAVTTVLLMVLAIFLVWAELHANPMFTNLGIDQTMGNMEDKETRFGVVASSLFTTIIMIASYEAVNAIHDSLTAPGGFVPMFLIQLDEVMFGGVGLGLYGMLVYVILVAFVVSLIISRTLEYLGRKTEVFEMKMMLIATLVAPLPVLVGTAVAVVVTQGKTDIFNPGTHGFSEVLYAFSSVANSNGSAFAGLSANTPFYNVALGIYMWLGYFWTVVPVLAMAGTFATKKRLPMMAGTLPTYGPLFVVLLIGSVLLVGVLTYVPVLVLGPIAEHLACRAHGKSSTQYQQVFHGCPLSRTRTGCAHGQA